MIKPKQPSNNIFSNTFRTCCSVQQNIHRRSLTFYIVSILFMKNASIVKSIYRLFLFTLLRSTGTISAVSKRSIEPGKSSKIKDSNRVCLS